MFKLIKQSKSKARLGQLRTRRGIIKTPSFMPIATKGAVKTLSSADLRRLNPDVILSNTYHLMLRPGEKELKRLGGLHKFMDWSGPILTDSGGFQVFSLAKIRKITEDGVKFSSHLDGKSFFLSPEDSIRIQAGIGADIMMVLDECVELPAEREYLEQSVELTTKWAKQCKDYFQNKMYSVQSENHKRPLLFGIVQGGLELDLRKKSAESLIKINLDGYAIGGLSVGETEQQMCSVLDYVNKILPKDKPRYLMGVGYPNQIIEAIKRGIDMFDCVIPTREARHGRLYFWNAKFSSGERSLLKLRNTKSFYSVAHITNEKFKFDLTPINEKSKIEELRKYSKAYLRYLFDTEEPLAWRLATLNNLEFYLDLLRRVRDELMSGLAF